MISGYSSTMTKRKGTPRKRPYDVRRKLYTAGKRDAEAQKLVAHSFGIMEVGSDDQWRCESSGRCLISAYMIGRKRIKAEKSLTGDAACYLGLTEDEVGWIIAGFDGNSAPDDEPKMLRWWDIGADLREELQPR